jgi:tetratricopeptide (TPR) repeat protein
MTDSPRPKRHAARNVSSFALAAALAFGATACSGDDGDKGASSSAEPDTKKAAAAVEAGLEAHSAGDLKAATVDYNKALEYEPTNKFAFYNLALIDVSNSNYGLAEDNYRSAIKTDAEYEPALFNLAILRTSSDPAEAISLYNRAVAVDKSDAAAWLNRGLLLRDQGRMTAGNKSVLRAIALNPKLKDPKAPAQGKGSTAR